MNCDRFYVLFFYLGLLNVFSDNVGEVLLRVVVVGVFFLVCGLFNVLFFVRGEGFLGEEVGGVRFLIFFVFGFLGSFVIFKIILLFFVFVVLFKFLLLEVFMINLDFVFFIFIIVLYFFCYFWYDINNWDDFFVLGDNVFLLVIGVMIVLVNGFVSVIMVVIFL